MTAICDIEVKLIFDKVFFHLNITFRMWMPGFQCAKEVCLIKTWIRALIRIGVLHWKLFNYWLTRVLILSKYVRQSYQKSVSFLCTTYISGVLFIIYNLLVVLVTQKQKLMKFQTSEHCNAILSFYRIQLFALLLPAFIQKLFKYTKLSWYDLNVSDGKKTKNTISTEKLIKLIFSYTTGHPRKKLVWNIPHGR